MKRLRKRLLLLLLLLLVLHNRLYLLAVEC
jgi:hypothetical protein